ncbi:hypothetical protein EDD21DRAFT_225826 [Dissophora ornata]|nr:hypothetical protein BGZ58_000231 [Dissophora ornata]KAI8597152.1 hypothetical protein EDD21DRAFT_225826 [Dissophora ornata]
MSESKHHPFEAASASEPPSTPHPGPSTSGNTVTFHEHVKSKESFSSPDLAPAPGGPVNQLRNRLDGKPLLTCATSELTSSIAGNPSCVSNLASALPPTAGPQRRSSGPGGRILQNDDATTKQRPRWTAHVSAFLKDLYSKYSPSLILENKGSIARDHLANERTYLAWLRTSLSLITVGVAVTQLFRLQSTSSSGTSSSELTHVAQMGRPLGGSFIALGMVFLWLGTSRYFHIQTMLSYGQFPASRGSVILATVFIMALLLACFIIVILQGKTS